MNLAYPLADLSSRNLSELSRGPWAHPETLPVSLALNDSPVSLNEGGTSVLKISDDDIWVKCEFQNPTGSHKDRAASVGVTLARERGASHVVAASSGNAGAAVAAYAARAGIPSVVLTTPGLRLPLLALIRAFGATLVTLDDSFKRNRLMELAVDQFDWFPMTSYVEPGAGSHPAMVEGYKSIAYELACEFGDDLGAVVIPTSRADLLSGVSRGFRELNHAGLHSGELKIVAAEPATGCAFVKAMTLSDHDDQLRVRVERGESPAFSIGSDCTNWQGLEALWAFGEHAISVTETEMVSETMGLARGTGLLLEASAAVAVTASRQVRPHIDGPIVALATSGGLRDPDLVIKEAGDELPHIDADLDALTSLL